MKKLTIALLSVLTTCSPVLAEEKSYTSYNTTEQLLNEDNYDFAKCFDTELRHDESKANACIVSDPTKVCNPVVWYAADWKYFAKINELQLLKQWSYNSSVYGNVRLASFDSVSDSTKNYVFGVHNIEGQYVVCLWAVATKTSEEP